MKHYKEDWIQMWKMKFTRKNYNEAKEELKFILWEK